MPACYVYYVGIGTDAVSSEPNSHVLIGLSHECVIDETNNIDSELCLLLVKCTHTNVDDIMNEHNIT